MTTSLLSAYARLASSALDRAIASLTARMLSPPPSHEMALAGVPGNFSGRPSSSAGDPSEDPLASGFDGLTWMQVAKKRRSLEKRMSRKYAKAQEIWGTSKLLKSNRDIRVEHSTAEYFLKNTLELKSYKRIMEETREIQQRTKEAFGIQPKNKEVIVLYDGEEDSFDSSKKLALEMPKERPAFFSKNLLQKTNPQAGRGGDGGHARPSNL